MGELALSLGINGKLFIAQLINFAIVLFVLYRFAYKPVLRMLEDRTQRIEKGIADAEASQKKLTEMTEKEKDVLSEAKKQAKQIIMAAEDQALKNRDEIIANAKEESTRLLQQAQKNMEDQKMQMINEVKKDLGTIVLMAVEKVIGEKVDHVKDAKMINDAINEN